MYTCTTSVPARLPVFVTSTRTWHDPPVRIRIWSAGHFLNLKGRIAQAEAESEQRRDIVPQIASAGGGLIIVKAGSWPTERGMLMGNLPPGLKSPNRTSATARPHSCPRYQHSRIAGTFSATSVDGKGRAIEQKNDDRLASCNHRLKEFVLATRQFQADCGRPCGSRPCFPGSLLVPADSRERSHRLPWRSPRLRRFAAGLPFRRRAESHPAARNRHRA